jgi:hypothetical protein
MSTPPQNQPGRGGSPGSPTPGRADSSELKAKAQDLGEQAKTEGKARIDEVRGTAADKLESLADSAQAAASTLQQDDVGHLSQYVSKLADSMTKFSSNLRDKSGDELLREIGQLARSNPALFVTGSIAIGFGLARFARASQPATTAMTTTGVEGTSTYSPQSGLGSAMGGEYGASGTASTSTSSDPYRPGASGTDTSSGTPGGIH